MPFAASVQDHSGKELPESEKTNLLTEFAIIDVLATSSALYMSLAKSQ